MRIRHYGTRVITGILGVNHGMSHRRRRTARLRATFPFRFRHIQYASLSRFSTPFQTRAAMSEPFSIRRAQPADLDALVPLFDGYRAFYGKPSQPTVCREFLQARLSRSESVIFIAFDAEGAGIGFAQLYPSFSSVRVRPIWWLNDLFVRPDGRGIGAGRALLDAAGEHARITGSAGLMLETGADNAYAQGLYERNGYQRVDPDSRFYWLSLG